MKKRDAAAKDACDGWHIFLVHADWAFEKVRLYREQKSRLVVHYKSEVEIRFLAMSNFLARDWNVTELNQFIRWSIWRHDPKLLEWIQCVLDFTFYPSIFSYFWYSSGASRILWDRCDCAPVRNAQLQRECHSGDGGSIHWFNVEEVEKFFGRSRWCWDNITELDIANNNSFEFTYA